MQYLADQKPDRKLIALAGTMERYHQIEWLNYIASEVHKSYGPLFSPETGRLPANCTAQSDE